VGLLFVRVELAAVPLVAFLVTVGTAPFFPGWGLFLPIVTHGPRTRPEVTLTFDDGPDPRSLPGLLELLATEGCTAAFFVVGRRAAAHPEAIRAILAAGHEVGNHSNTHDVFLALRSPTRIRSEIRECERALAVHGVRPLAFRPPVGITSPLVGRALRGLGLRCVAFSCRPLDFGSRRIDDLAGRVLRRARAGDIILLHDALPVATAVETWMAEVRKILAGLREKGLAPVALSRLIGGRVMESGPAPAEGPETGTAAGTGGDAGGILERASQVLTFLFTLAYPLLVALSVGLLGARFAALVLLSLLALTRIRTLRRDLRRARGLTALGASVAVLLVMAAVLDDPRFLLAYPSLVNAVLLVQFAWSLRGGGSIVQRFAQIEVIALSPAEIRYCRSVTLAWCVFFVLNGSACTALALLAPRAVWAIYTGGIAYLLMGLLFAGEYVVRKSRFGRFGAHLVDRILARLLGRAEGTR
jgi:uncharacterized membrane protein/peptidoglycan/xylan/chitin deacetylase (PgdA/CDA1 family)